MIFSELLHQTRKRLAEIQQEVPHSDINSTKVQQALQAEIKERHVES